MNKKTTYKTLILAATVSLGLGSAGFAGEGPTTTASAAPVTSNAATPTAGDLLGRRYAGLTFDYYDLGNGAPSVAHGYTFEANLPMISQLDFKLTHEYSEAEAFGQSARNNTTFASVVGYAPGY